MTASRAAGAAAVASPHAAATEVAADLLRGGATALDAAIAAAAMLAVAYPHMCGVGGDVMALHAAPDGDVVALNGSGAAPAAATIAGVGARDGAMPVTGPHAVTVPGAVHAWGALHARGATRALAELLEPARGAAAEGIAVAPSVAAAIEEDAHALRRDPGLAALLFDGGVPLPAGARLVQPALARTLEAIAADGPGALHGGSVGAAYAAGLRVVGSPMTADDLAGHATEQTAPLRATWGEDELLTAPPNSTGFVLLEALGALAATGARDPLGADADLLAEVLRATAADRDRHLADPRTHPVPVDALLAPEHLAGVAAAARRSRDAPDGRSRPAAPRATGDTVALVVADAAGHAVVVIQSLFHSFGARILEPATGIIAHNRGASFVLDPDAPAALGGGRRPPHTLMPLLVRRAGRVVGLHGTMGGRAQPQIHAQLLLALRAGADVADAVAAPRWVLGGLGAAGSDEVVAAEPGLPAAARAALARTGPVHPLPARSEHVGHAQLIRRAADDGGWIAASDPRADGSAAAIG